ncbi:hypothetical protein MD273_07980 [Marinobacter pelagius]|uniref:hypothetical protein n=1 Tax=Marinobacter sp. C7 TaxID=2951363 RepID=UPI001EF05428|nr:hypothetical protein [Marinobacter sp. C7]MCG7199660.1 hypothetical protein [Marinobacter sp. C7]
MNEALPDLIARFRIKQGLFRKELVEAAVFELDSYGCVMKTDKVFEPGDSLTLDLVMDMPFEEICAQSVSGLVTERRKHCSNFYYSIDFSEFEPGSPNRDKLKRIREVLSRKLSLKSRRSSSGSISGFRQMA